MSNHQPAHDFAHIRLPVLRVQNEFGDDAVSCRAPAVVLNALRFARQLLVRDRFAACEQRQHLKTNCSDVGPFDEGN